MILDQDTRPDRQIYHLGAVLLGVLIKEAEFVEPHLVYERVNRLTPVSSGAFILALDWLFMLGAIVADGGRIRRCF